MASQQRRITLLAAALAFLAAARLAEAATLLAARTGVTPVEKVTKLLEDLKAEVESDGSTEAASYHNFACFCKSTTSGKSSSITGGQDSIDLLSSAISSDTANKNKKQSELQERKARQEDLVAELKATQVRCAKEQATYEATAADLSKAISSLESASKALNSAKPQEALIALRSEPVARALALGDALSLVGARKRQAVSAFLQSRAGDVPSDDPEYKYKSQGIIDTIEQLLVDFKGEKGTVDTEWAATKKSCKDTKTALSDEMGSNSAAMSSLEDAIDVLTGQIAGSREDLVEAENVLKDDQLYIGDLTKRCEARAKDWDQRSQMRASELQALSQALELLRSNVTGADAAVNKRALLLQHALPAGAKALSFLQERGLTSQARQKKVERMLRSEGRRLGSAALASVAAQALAAEAAASDPFMKVKDLIQKLVERLLAESTAEATKKGFCDEELGKATQDRDFRYADVQKLNAELAKLEAKKDSLEESTASLQLAVGELQENLANATSLRADEKAANIAAIKQAREGLEALTDALVILKNFYKEAGKAAALVQWSPVDEDTSGPGFAGAYAGKQEASTGIIGLLQVIKADFERTIRTTEASEKSALAEHVEFDRASKTDISGKSTQNMLELEALEVTGSSIAQKMSDLQTATDLLGDALARLEDLKPTCVDLTMPYEVRVQKREEEMAALKRALCILDTEKVESECQS